MVEEELLSFLSFQGFTTFSVTFSPFSPFLLLSLSLLRSSFISLSIGF